MKQIIKNINILFGLLLLLIMAPIVFIICFPPFYHILSIPWSKSYVESLAKIGNISVYIGLGLCGVLLVAWLFYLIKLKYKKKNIKEIFNDSDIDNSKISPTNKKIINMLEDLNLIIEKEQKDNNY